ncbi:hypothetical protein GQ54DRAFT_181924 [Martensiomyces pterosporus]|nr:hypothetical protein GQ54DRAFT_181924 [Martensiomyces pterosporus]
MVQAISGNSHDGGVATVTAEISGQLVEAVVDTGADAAFVAEALCQELGIEVDRRLATHYTTVNPGRHSTTGMAKISIRIGGVSALMDAHVVDSLWCTGWPDSGRHRFQALGRVPLRQMRRRHQCPPLLPRAGPKSRPLPSRRFRCGCFR